MDAPTQRVKIFLIATGVWLLVVCTGIILHDVRPAYKDLLPLKWYDWLFKNLGPLLPWAPYLLRIFAVFFKANQECPTRPPLYEVSLVYLAMAGLRGVVYMLHLIIQKSSGEFMSDHILLAASIICTLQIEGIFLWRELPRSRGEYQQIPGETGSVAPWRRLLLGFSLILGIALFVLTCGEAFNTALYYHSRSDSLISLGLGLVLFQVPSTIWIHKRM